LQAGRSSGAARVFRPTAAMSDVGQQRSTAATTFNADIASAREGMASRKVTYDDLIANLTASVGNAKTAYESALPGFNEAALKAKATATAGVAAADKSVTDARYTSVLYGSFPGYSGAYDTVRATLSAEIADTLDHIKKGYTGAWITNYEKQVAALKTLNTQRKATIDSRNTAATAAGTAYKTAIDQVNANSKTSFDTYQGTILDANKQQQEGYQAYVGQENTLRDRFNTERNAIEGLGYLAQAAPTLDMISPSASSAQDQPDIYSTDIANLMQGRKQLAQSTRATSPEDDLLTGAMQSSIYSRT
jgi:hypothetical protein